MSTEGLQSRLTITLYTLTPDGERRGERPGIGRPDAREPSVTANPLSYAPCECRAAPGP
ncbi:hypothetical protein AB0G42_32090 [Streptomyces yangpuensis]|uniref:hypothetical protein n=1 Tax=Streptomyces yangpuensis TaxID=1648182 RepID=UPI003447706B